MDTSQRLSCRDRLAGSTRTLVGSWGYRAQFLKAGVRPESGASILRGWAQGKGLGHRPERREATSHMAPGVTGKKPRCLRGGLESLLGRVTHATGDTN